MIDKIAQDYSVLGEAIIKNCILDTFPKRIWGAWQVLIGNAGILIVRVNPRKVYLKESIWKRLKLGRKVWWGGL